MDLLHNCNVQHLEDVFFSMQKQPRFPPSRANLFWGSDELSNPKSVVYTVRAFVVAGYRPWTAQWKIMADQAIDVLWWRVAFKDLIALLTAAAQGATLVWVVDLSVPKKTMLSEF